MIVTDTQAALAEWLCPRIGYVPTPRLQCIGRVGAEGQIIGVIGYDNFTGTSMQMHSAGEGNWLSSKFLQAIFDYPFNVCGAKVVFAYVCSTNERALTLNTRVGFKYEHTLKDVFKDGDAIIMSMRAEDCKYLKENKYGR